jgi:molybdenum cofactor cytidylyltransferase
MLIVESKDEFINHEGALNMKRFSAVILAAGVSKRLGFNKLTLKINRESVIRKAVLPFISAGIGRIFIVTGIQSQDIHEGLAGCAVEFIENKDCALGMSSSVKASLPFITDEEGVFFHLGDKPFLEKEMIFNMIDMYRLSREKIIVPVFNGEKGHPVLMDVSLYSEEIKSLQGDKGLREIIEKHAADVIFIKGNEGSLYDIDTTEDVERLKERGYIIEKG